MSSTECVFTWQLIHIRCERNDEKYIRREKSYIMRPVNHQSWNQFEYIRNACNEEKRISSVPPVNICIYRRRTSRSHVYVRAQIVRSPAPARKPVCKCARACHFVFIQFATLLWPTPGPSRLGQKALYAKHIILHTNCTPNPGKIKSSVCRVCVIIYVWFSIRPAYKMEYTAKPIINTGTLSPTRATWTTNRTTLGIGKLYTNVVHQNSHHKYLYNLV